MPDYARFGLMSAAFSQGNPQSFISDIKRLVRNAKAEIKELKELEDQYARIGLVTTVSRGRMPRSQWVKTSSYRKMQKARRIAPRLNELRGLNLGAQPRARLVRLLAAWTQFPFREPPYTAVSDHLPNSGNSDLAEIA